MVEAVLSRKNEIFAVTQLITILAIAPFIIVASFVTF